MATEIKLIGPDGNTHLCQIDCSVSWPSGPIPDVRFEANSQILGEFIVIQTDAFECLCRYREYLHSKGFKPLCVGARIDAFPSGMGRDMGNGFAVYITEMGKPAQNEPVGIFEAAPVGTIVTVAEQKQRFDQWITSDKLDLGKGRKNKILARIFLVLAAASFLFLFAAEGYLTGNAHFMEMDAERTYAYEVRGNTFYLERSWAYALYSAYLFVPCAALGALILEVYQRKFSKRGKNK